MIKSKENFHIYIGQILILLLALIIPFLFTDKTLEAGSNRLIITQITVAITVSILLFTLCLTPNCHLPSLNLNQAIVLLTFPVFIILNWLLNQGKAFNHLESWRMIILILLMFLGTTLFYEEQSRKILLIILSISAFGICIYAFIQKLGYDPIQWSKPSNERVFATIGNPNMLAAYCIAIMPITFLSAFAVKSKIYKTILFIVSAMLCLTFILTECRGAALGIICTIITALLIYRKSLFKSKKHFIIASIICACAIIIISIPMFNRLDDLKHLGENEVSTSNVRLVIWEGTAKMIKDNAMVGVGPGQFQVRFPEYRPLDFEQSGVTNLILHAHCEPLEILAELGILGFIAYVLMIGFILYFGLKILKTQEGLNFHFLVGIICAIIALIGHNLVSVNLRWSTSPFLFFLFLGLILGYLPRTTIRLNKQKRLIAFCVFLIAATGLSLGAKTMSLDWYKSECLTMEGQKYNAIGAWKKAEDKFLKAIDANSENLRAFNHLAISYFQQGRYKDAIKTYHDLQKFSFNYGKIHYNLTTCHLRLGEWEQAARECALQRKIGGLPQSFQFEKLLSTLKSKKSHEEIYLKSLEQLVLINPKKIRARLMLADFLFRKKRYNEAKLHYIKILEINENFMPALNNIAGIYFVEGNFEKARDICQKILTMTPNEVLPLFNLGKAQFKLKDYQSAKLSWERASKLAPDNSDINDYLKMIPKM